MPKLLSFSIITTTFAFANLGLAQTTSASAAPETIIVTATKIPQKARSIGASVTVLDGPLVQTSAALPLTDLLRDVPSVSFSRNGGVGTLTSVRIRGGEADQTVMLIDGVQINDPSTPGGGHNFGNLLTGDVERIEILRGPQSTLYGSQAIGGVINLITRQPTKPFEGSGAFEAGELDTYALRGDVRGIVGGLRYAVSASRYETGGISSASAGSERDSFENTGAQARVTYTVNALLDLEARAWISQGDVGIDGFPPPSFALSDTLERSKTDEQIFYGGANVSLLEGRWRTRFSLSQAKIDRDSINPTLSAPLTFRANGTNDRFEVQSTYHLNERVQIVGGIENERSKFVTASPSSSNPNPVPARAQVDSNAAYLQIQATPIEGITATLGVRQTDHEKFGDVINTRATLAWAFNNGNSIVRGAIADGFKAPTLFQLFSDFGNVTLAPEEASSVEFGLEQALFSRRLIGAITWFDRTTTNQIDFISCFNNPVSFCVNRPFGTYNNIARTKASGIEATLEARPFEAFTIKAGYSTLDARNDVIGNPNFGRRLARRPDETAFVTATWQFGQGRDISATYSSIGQSFENASNTTRLAPYELMSVRGNWALSEVWNLYARVENAGDETYQTAFRYGSTPRQAFVGVRAAF